MLWQPRGRISPLFLVVEAVMSVQQQIVPLPFAPDGQPVMSLDLVKCGSVAVITISGEMDFSTAHLLTELIQHVVREHPARVVVDMANVNFLGLDALRTLIQARDTVNAAGGQLALCAPSAQTWRVLTITGTDHLFPLAPQELTASAAGTVVGCIHPSPGNGGGRGPCHCGRDAEWGQC
jgi:anti-anti-sigma factor